MAAPWIRHGLLPCYRENAGISPVIHRFQGYQLVMLLPSPKVGDSYRKGSDGIPNFRDFPYSRSDWAPTYIYIYIYTYIYTYIYIYICIQVYNSIYKSTVKNILRSNSVPASPVSKNMRKYEDQEL